MLHYSAAYTLMMQGMYMQLHKQGSLIAVDLTLAFFMDVYHASWCALYLQAEVVEVAVHHRLTCPLNGCLHTVQCG